MLKQSKLKRMLGMFIALVLLVTVIPINTTGITKTIAASRLANVVSSKTGGAYVGQVTVELSHEVADAKIYYTLDGSLPTKNSTVYTEPITITSTCTLQAFAVKEGYYDSLVSVEKYTILSGLEFKKSDVTISEFEQQDMKNFLSISKEDCSGITWSSSNSEMAAINSDGILTGKKEGGTVVTAAAKDGTMAQCMVTVKAPDFSIPASKKINIGTSVSLYASSKKYANKITWKSSKSSVASVDSNGYVTAKNAGSCTIKAACGSTTKNCKITVPAVKLKINASSVKISYGKGKQLKASGNIAASWIKWKSSNSKVASVNSSGYVTGKSAGTCVITAYYGSGKATCKVTIPQFKLKGPKSITLYSGEKRAVTKGLSINGMAVYSASAKTADKKIVEVKKGYLIGKRAGTTKVTITANGKKFSCKVKVPKTTIKTPKSLKVKFQANANITPTIKVKRGTVYITKAKSSNPSNVSITYTGKTYVTVYGKKSKSSAKITLYFSNGTKKTVSVSVPDINIDEKLLSQKAYVTTTDPYEDTSGSVYHNATIYNNTGKLVSFVKYAVLEYDNKGDRLSTNKKQYLYDYNDYLSNGYHVTISNYLSSDARKVRVCIKKVWFEDGSTWENPLYSSWYNKYKKEYEKK